MVYFQHLSAAHLHLSLFLGNVEKSVYSFYTESLFELTQSMVLMLTQV